LFTLTLAGVAAFGGALVRTVPSLHPDIVKREMLLTPFYFTCADARRADVAPMMRYDPGYRVELDADRDGVACEPWLGG
jgi:hypothetical protein